MDTLNHGRSPRARLVGLTFAVALLVRLLLAPTTGWRHDVLCFQMWSEQIEQHGLSRIYDCRWCDYPPGYLYVLALIGHMRSGLPQGLEQNPFVVRALLKLPAIITDLLAAWVMMLYLRRRYGGDVAFRSAVFYLFNPAAIFLSAFWGQVDVIPALLVLVALMAVAQSRTIVAYVALALSIWVKLQMGIFVPLLLLASWRVGGWRALIKGFAATLGLSLLVLAPFLWNGTALSCLRVPSTAVGRMPYLSMNAYNIWWLLSAGQGITIPDVYFFSWGMTYRTLGIIAFLTYEALVLISFWTKAPREEYADRLLLQAVLIGFGFFMIPTEMHERYIFPVLVFLCPLTATHSSLRSKYWILSLLIFGSFLFAYCRSNLLYEGALLAFLQDEWWYRVLSMVLSVGYLAMFSIFSWEWLKQTSVTAIGAVSAIGLIVCIGLSVRTMLFPTYLDNLTPSHVRQGWGELKQNRSVEGNPLSVNGTVFRRGLGTHANSEMVFCLAGLFRRFQASAGIDDEGNSGNSVQFLVYGDGRLLFDSGVTSGRRAPMDIDVDISGIDRLSLQVSDGGDGIQCDHVDWLNARVVP